MEENERFQEVKEREIKRLTTPLTYKKEAFGLVRAAYDCEGQPVECTYKGYALNHTGKYILEPKPGILTDEEILMYAPESETAAKIRRKREKRDTSVNNEKTGGGNASFNLFIPMYTHCNGEGPFNLENTGNNICTSIMWMALLHAIHKKLQGITKQQTKQKYTQ